MSIRVPVRIEDVAAAIVTPLVATLAALFALVVLATPSSAQTPSSSTSRLTARQVIERIHAHAGVPVRETTVDAFNIGDPDTPVTGIAVTMMATFDVLKRAAAANQNLIITHEPLFFNHQGDVSELERDKDTVYAAKRAFIEQHHLIVWRFHDSWHDRRPDGILTGMVHALGWEAYQQKDPPYVFVIPETTLGALAKRMKQTLNARTLRIIGDPAMKVTKVGLQPGFAGFPRNRPLMQRDDVQVGVIGEGHEWEIGEYAADAVTAGLHKGLIVIGHIPSEQAGMDECARWMKTFVSEVPVVFVPATQPYAFVN